MLIFLYEFANRSWQCISSATLAQKTLCCMENDTAEAMWDGRSQAGLLPPCGFCVFTTACTKGQYNKTVKLKKKKKVAAILGIAAGKYWAHDQKGLKFKCCSASLLDREASFTIFKTK